MLNLLFISDSPKTEHVKSVLQPELKVIIDVVNDFDHGLKDVFEKRPATVCIQDQIGGVTGESVARHIQMLLGASSPRFILLHSGNGKARAINGLFEHLIDLNQTDDALTGEIRNTLKTLLGDNWEKVYIPPKSAPASVRTSVSVPEESREDADRLVDDFISDLETSGFLVGDEPPPALLTPGAVLDENPVVPQTEVPRDPELSSGTAESDRAQAINDDLAELLVLEVDKARHSETLVPGSSAAPEPDGAPVDVPKPVPIVEKPPLPAASENAVPVKSSTVRKTAKKPAASLSGIQEDQSVAASVTQPHAVHAPVPPVTVSVPPAAAEFRINHTASPDEEHIPEDLLLAFEENYRSESPFFRRSVVLVLVCVVCAAGGWFLFTQKPRLLTSLQQRFMPASGTKQTPAVPSPPPAAPAPKPVVAVVAPAAAVSSLPAFVPKEGHDSSYAAKNPGWERYVGKNAEFRLFSASGRIQALQVIAVKGAPFSESYIKSVLQEYTGSSEYQRTSSSVKAGVHVENGRVKDRAEVKIYRKNGAVKAFVVSVN
ncbi:MAG: hypothetical protein A2076_17220 [Geobacteraceae bacterium GWC2_53_11]|nr:MAG: hypothetical protein A2076_17220 [Geobacteraceae bacterium GWC2_53_11]